MAGSLCYADFVDILDGNAFMEGKAMAKSPTQQFTFLESGRQKDILSAVLVLASEHGEGAGILRGESGNIVLSSGKSIPHGRIGSDLVGAAIDMAYHEGIGTWKDGLHCPKTVMKAAEGYLRDRGLTAENVLSNPRFELWRMQIDPARGNGLDADKDKNDRVNALFLVEDNPFFLISMSPIDGRASKDTPELSFSNETVSGLRFNRSPIASSLALPGATTMAMKSHHEDLVASIRNADTDHTLVASNLSEEQLLRMPGLRDMLNVSFMMTPEQVEEARDMGTLPDTIEHMNAFLDAQTAVIKQCAENRPTIAPDPAPPRPAPARSVGPSF